MTFEYHRAVWFRPWWAYGSWPNGVGHSRCLVIYGFWRGVEWRWKTNG